MGDGSPPFRTCPDPAQGVSRPAPPPLAGLRVVVTRAAHQAAGLCRAFEAAGARVVSLPLLEIAAPEDRAPLRRAAARLGTFEWVLFPSRNAVDALADLASPSPPTRLAVVGQATGRALKNHGLSPDLAPSRQEAEGLLEEILPRLRPEDRVLLPQAEDARATLAAGLRDHCRLTVVTAYRKVLPARAAALAQEHLGQDPIGWVTFTSPRIVRHFVELLGSQWESRRMGVKALSIGPITSAALLEHGIEAPTEAAEPSIAGLVAALRSSGRL